MSNQIIERINKFDGLVKSLKIPFYECIKFIEFTKSLDGYEKGEAQTFLNRLFQVYTKQTINR